VPAPKGSAAAADGAQVVASLRPVKSGPAEPPATALERKPLRETIRRAGFANQTVQGLGRRLFGEPLDRLSRRQLLELQRWVERAIAVQLDRDAFAQLLTGIGAGAEPEAVRCLLAERLPVSEPRVA
jgi:hypothetical protein